MTALSLFEETRASPALKPVPRPYQQATLPAAIRKQVAAALIDAAAVYVS